MGHKDFVKVNRGSPIRQIVQQCQRHQGLEMIHDQFDIKKTMTFEVWQIRIQNPKSSRIKTQTYQWLEWWWQSLQASICTKLSFFQRRQDQLQKILRQIQRQNFQWCLRLTHQNPHLFFAKKATKQTWNGQPHNFKFFWSEKLTKVCF